VAKSPVVLWLVAIESFSDSLDKEPEEDPDMIAFSIFVLGFSMQNSRTN
jgi:hypothetical protein